MINNINFPFFSVLVLLLSLSSFSATSTFATSYCDGSGIVIDIIQLKTGGMTISITGSQKAKAYVYNANNDKVAESPILDLEDMTAWCFSTANLPAGKYQIQVESMIPFDTGTLDFFLK